MNKRINTALIHVLLAVVASISSTLAVDPSPDYFRQHEDEVLIIEERRDYWYVTTEEEMVVDARFWDRVHYPTALSIETSSRPGNKGGVRSGKGKGQAGNNQEKARPSSDKNNKGGGKSAVGKKGQKPSGKAKNKYKQKSTEKRNRR